MVPKPLNVGMYGKGEMGPNLKGYETSSEQKADAKPINVESPTTTQKEKVEEESPPSPILQTKRKKDLEVGNKNNLAIRYVIQLLEVQVDSPLKDLGG